MSDTTPPPRPEIMTRVKAIMRRDLKLGDEMAIPDDMPFFGGEADIDSLDILLLLGSVEKEFGIKIPNEAVGRQVFESVATLVNYVEQQIAAAGGKPVPGPSIGQINDPLARLPHGPEFRFVTRVVALRPGESAEAVWAVKGDEPFFAGHFPGRPIVPGVLIAEAMAQAAGLAVPIGEGPAAGGMDGKLVQVEVRFEQPVVPPAEIVLRCQMTRAIAGLYQFSVTASVGSVVVSKGSLTLNVSPVEMAAVGGAK